MGATNFKRFVRRVGSAAAIAGCLAAPAFAFGTMGFHGGFHGSFRGVPRAGVGRPAPPAIDTPPLRPPLVTAPPPVRIQARFVKIRRGDFFRFRKDRFGRRVPWGWWGGGYGTYAIGGAEPVYYPAQAAPAAEPAPCAELLTWSPRLGRAIRQNLCDAPPSGIAMSQGLVPRG